MYILYPRFAYLPGSVPKDGSYPEHLRRPSRSPLVRFCLSSPRIASERALKANQTLELYDCPRLCYLECTSRFCCRARYPQLGCYDAEDEGRDYHPLELGE